MNEYLTGAVIRELREKNHFTQAQLAEKLNVSDKTISKWETSKGYPDITLLKPIASVFGVSIMELLSGKAITNVNVSANMLRSKFYVCPVCGNVIHSIGEIAVSCHGISGHQQCAGNQLERFICDQFRGCKVYKSYVAAACPNGLCCLVNAV